MAKQLTVEVWSDIACPWCYVGKRRLEAALARFPQRDQVKVTWRSFELDPSAPPIRDANQSYAQRLASKYGSSVSRAEEMIKRMVDTAALDGIAMDFAIAKSGNTFHAHRLLHLAKARGLQHELAERFMRGYLSEGAAIDDADTLRRLAVETGLDEELVNGLLNGDLYAEDVRNDQREAREIGVDGVPFFLFGRRYAVAGAQPAELLLEVLNKSWEELAEQPVSVAAAQGDSCGPDGC